jgi:outer membrane protein assembly factor BamE (lipoprotein component of BamABCDE complex)
MQKSIYLSHILTIRKFNICVPNVHFEKTMKTTWSVQRLAIVLVWCVLLSVVLSGCIYVGSDSSRVNLNEETASKIIPGKTTRQEVVTLLGQPDEVSGNRKQFTYVRKYEVALMPAGGLGSGKQSNSADRYLLKVEFDEKDIVSRRDFIAPYELHDKPLHGVPPYTSPHF